MIRANALLFTILISIIIGIIVSVFFVTALFYNYIYLQNNAYEDAEWALTSGINYLHAHPDKIKHNTVSKVSLFNNQDTVIYNKKSWGMFDIAFVSVLVNEDTIQKVFLSGGLADSIQSAALYIADNERPIMFAGKTKIYGRAYLPKSGVKKTSIDSEYFTEEKTINGEIKDSKSYLPAFNNSTIERLIEMCNPSTWKHHFKHFEMMKELPYYKYENSFLNKTQVYYRREPIVIRRKNLSGNILIVSDTIVQTEEDVVLNDVIIWAKKVYIGSGTKGNFQAFATDTAVVENNTKLLYPSVIGVIQSDTTKKTGVLELGKRVSLQGLVLLYTTNKQNALSRISIDEGAMIRGEIYSQAFVQLKGTLLGNMICQKSYLQSPAAFYENHFLNSVIDRRKLSLNYVYPKTGRSNVGAVAKYLY